jgi:hypothetical protein
MSIVKTGDWCVYDLNIVQIMATEPYLEYSTGIIRGGNATREHMRPLTLKNKVIVEGMDHYYNMLRDMDGESGFNYPDINRYFSTLARQAMDGSEADAKAAWDKAQKFVNAARDYQKVIDGVRLFRPK